MNTKFPEIKMKHLQSLKSIAAQRGIEIHDVFLIGLHAIEALERKTKRPLRRAHELIQEGAEALKRKVKTVSFAQAVHETLMAKSHRRKRTLQDIRYITSVFMRKTQGLANRKVRSIKTKECTEMIMHCFHTTRQRYKARLILHGVFAVALRRAWCAENPVSHVDVPRLKETPILALNVEQSQRLIRTARQEEHGECLAALGMMLYAGIRPQEVQRLQWTHVNLEEKVISIPPTHSKTGGIRHVSIEPVLLHMLSRIQPENKERKICPPLWLKKWKSVRNKAGWNIKNPWTQDCLRHSYASFHALYYKNFNRLQYEMGHSSSQLLRSRYLNMQGLTQHMAKSFWKVA